MDQNYQQLDLQALIDLLAEETQQYTRAFISGNQEETSIRKTIIDALVVEVNRRRKVNFQPPNAGLEIPPNDFFETSS
jgi:hypothetical protein